MTATVFFNSTSELATLTNVFKVGGTATDPSTVTLTVTSPSGAVTTPTATHGVTGTYSADITCNEDGTWSYLWEGTGTASDAEAGTWDVQETALGRLYCTVEALKSRLSIEHSAVDFEVHGACFAASRWVETYCDRVFYRTASQARTFEPDDLWCLEFGAFNDLVSASSVKTDTARDGSFGTTWSATDYQLLPYNPGAAPEQRPYTSIRAIGTQTFPYVHALPGRRNVIQITGVWGWPKVPPAVKQATAIVAADLFALKDAPLGAEGSADFTTSVGDNRRAMRLLDPYRRYPVLLA